jgi:hypothetical protein
MYAALPRLPIESTGALQVPGARAAKSLWNKDRENRPFSSDMPEDGVVHRLYFRLRRRARRRQCGRGLLAQPRLAPAPVRREGRFLGGAEFHAGAQGGHQLGAARRRGGPRGTVFGVLRAPSSAIRDAKAASTTVASTSLRPGGRGEARQLAQEPVA